MKRWIDAFETGMSRKNITLKEIEHVELYQLTYFHLSGRLVKGDIEFEITNETHLKNPQYEMELFLE